MTLYQLTAENKKVSPVMDVPKEAAALADRGMLDFIIRNLLSNAIKTPAWGTIKIIVAVERERTAACKRGRSIAEADMLRILDTEDTFSTPGTARERSSGLGLCSRFWFYLPSSYRCFILAARQ